MAWKIPVTDVCPPLFYLFEIYLDLLMLSIIFRKPAYHKDSHLRSLRLYHTVQQVRPCNLGKHQGCISECLPPFGNRWLHIWCTVGYFSLQRNTSRRRNKLLALLPQQAAGWEPEKLWVQDSFTCSQSPQLLQESKTRQFHQEAEGHELTKFFSLL